MDPTAASAAFTIAEQTIDYGRGSNRLMAFSNADLKPGTYGKLCDWFQMTPSIEQTLTFVIPFTGIARRQKVLPGNSYRKIGKNNSCKYPT
jgi:hypothetical protein